MNVHATTRRPTASAILLLVTLLLQGWASCVQAQDVKVSASLNATEFPEDQAVRLTVTVTGSGAAQPEQPKGDGLHIVYQGQNRRMEWINGKGSSSVSFAFMVQAETAGRHTIGPIKVKVDGKSYSTNPLTCTVLPLSAAKTPPASQQSVQPGQNTGPAARLRSGEAEKIGFMRIVPEKKKIYSGELVPFTIKAYFRRGMRVTIKSAPRFIGDNFVLHTIDEKPLQNEETVNGTPYSTLVWQGTLSAVKEGSFPLEVEMDASLLVRAQRQRPSNPFGSPFFDDPFFDNFFAQFSQRDVKVASPKQKIQVLDLPANGRPDIFNGAIGTFSMAVAASPLDDKVGDPITLKMMITGTGNFDTVQSPRLADEQDWKIYPAKADFMEQGPGRGKKTFEQAIVPTAKVQQIPPVRFCYFDPDTGEYVVVNSDPINLHLSAGAAAPHPAPMATNPAPEAKTSLETATGPANLAPLHSELGALVPGIVPLYRQPWFVLVVAGAVLCLLVALAFSVRRRKLAADPSILRRKEVNRQIEDHFRAMDKAIAANDEIEFRRHCRAAIQQRLAEKWDVEAPAITLADLEKNLAGDNPLLEMFRRLELAGYGGEILDSSSMQTMLQLSRTELDNF